MRHPLASLERLAYPGRLIVIGRDVSGAFHVVIYAVTGRSPSSQARKLVAEGNAVWTKPTDPDVLKKGNPDLLVYPALILGEGIAVSNGRQTADIDPRGEGSPIAVLERGLKSWSFEPDAPIFTPRINGCVLLSNRTALGYIRRGAQGEAVPSFFELSLAPGEGKMISTYRGENCDPLPAFEGGPLDLGLAEASAAETAAAVYESLGPRAGGPDFRVAVACVFARVSDLRDYRLHIINREERIDR